ncbi:MAG: 50S ribosomal protein L11 [Bacteroidota bacterium]
MPKAIKEYLKIQVKGNEAKPAPPIGPALGSKGLNIMEFCKRFNAETQDKPGEVLPVVITVYQDKSFDFIIKNPPVAAGIMKKTEIKKGSPEPNRKKVATLSWEDVQEIATRKMPDLNTLHLSAAMKMVAGTARSMGVSVQGEMPAPH